MEGPISSVGLQVWPAPVSSAEVERLREQIVTRLRFELGLDPLAASERDWFTATARAVRDRMVEVWTASAARDYENCGKRVCYLSLEFLIGRLLFDGLGNLGLIETARAALAGLGIDLDRLAALEPDAALGNGGLGRLAACFMDSMATLGISAVGYGIRYDHGLFQQVIRDGAQQEIPEDWLMFGNPWEFERSSISYAVGFGGSVTVTQEPGGRITYAWQPAETVNAVAHDVPVVGYAGRHANTLRLWRARADTPLRFEDFNRGDHVGAVRDRARIEAISRMLYPNDETPAGQELRLRQEYFFSSASLQDTLRRHLSQFGELRSLPDHVAIQLNDTHPAIGIAELMRLLVDEHGMGWDEAWQITVATFSYTNHTLLPEALEIWPVGLLEATLPRHLQIIYRINFWHLDRMRRVGHANDQMLAAVSLIDEQHGRRVRMGHLAFIASHHVNGVSALHTELMRRTTFRDLVSVYPDRISNKTNGISFRRWLHRANPGLTALLVETLGERVLRDPDALAELAPLADDAGFRTRFAAQRLERKRRLAAMIQTQLALPVDPEALFDVHVKRIHEYKRQLLNILHTVVLWLDVRDNPGLGCVPRVKLFGGKAAPGYYQAKRIIQLAHDVASVVNHDPDMRDCLKLAFLPNYGVSLAEALMPAADLSEQISTAGMEASGTGNMKLALNGALTIGTLDGANVEIRDHVGADNIFIFGLTAPEVEARRRGRAGADIPSPMLRRALDAIASGQFSPNQPDRYRGLVERLLSDDRYMVISDFDAYVAAQARVDAHWRDPGAWWRTAVLNTAGMGWFSADRAIHEYAVEIWHVPLTDGSGPEPDQPHAAAIDS
jgi:starch phosphorylase